MTDIPPRVQRLELVDYRNLAHAQIEFDPGFTVLAGPNGAGKTNILEALVLLSTLRSFRTNDLAPLVRVGAQGARVTLWHHDPRAELTGTLSVRLERRGTGVRREARADGKLVRRSAAFLGRLPVVLFTSEDLVVIRGGPAARRKLLDRVAFGREPAHLSDVLAYDRAMRARNRILRDVAMAGVEPDAHNDLLAGYEAQLAEIGARIWTRRARAIEALAPLFRAGMEHIAPGLDARVLYDARLEARVGPVAAGERAHALADGLRTRRRDDLQRGQTTTGPHRDDVVFLLGERPAATFASQGQTRALVLAFKLAELRLAHIDHGAMPLLLLDDVSSELDEARTEALFATLTREAGQCLLTTTDPGLLQLGPTASVRTYRVRDGRLEGGCASGPPASL